MSACANTWSTAIAASCAATIRRRILNDPSLKLLARAAVCHVEAGADIVAPSDMMDGRVRAIRAELDGLGFPTRPSCPMPPSSPPPFTARSARRRNPRRKFGDRRSYQMDAANAREALREVALDIQEGADIVMVKPALAYLDILIA